MRRTIASAAVALVAALPVIASAQAPYRPPGGSRLIADRLAAPAGLGGYAGHAFRLSSLAVSSEQVWKPFGGGPELTAIPDGSVGRGPRGVPVAVYSRCPGTGSRPACSLWILDLATGRRSAVPRTRAAGYSDRSAAISGRRLVWVRTSDAAADAPARLMTRLLGTGGRVHALPVPVGSLRIEQLAVSGDLVAYTTVFDGCCIGERYLVLLRVGDRRAPHVLADRPIGLSGESFHGVAFIDGSLRWLVSCDGDPAGCTGRGRHLGLGFLRYRLRARRIERAPPKPPFDVEGYLPLHGGDLLSLGAAGVGGVCDGICRIYRLPRLHYAPVPAAATRIYGYPRFTTEPRLLPPLRGCRLDPKLVVVRDAVATVFAPDKQSDDGPSLYFGCVRGAGRAIHLASDDLSEPRAAIGFALRGSIVAFDDDRCPGLNSCTARLTDVDLRSGDRRVTVASGVSGRVYGARGAGQMHLTSRRRYAVALVADGTYSAPVIRIYARDAAGLHLLDEGRDVSAASLKVTGSTVSWTNGRTMRTALLGP